MQIDLSVVKNEHSLGYELIMKTNYTVNRIKRFWGAYRSAHITKLNNHVSWVAKIAHPVG